MIKQLQTETGLSSQVISTLLKLNYRRLLRWQKRTSAGEPALVSPGPKKTGPLPFAQVREQIAALRHGHRRTHGTTQLQAQLQGSISRRELARLVKEERGRKNAEKVRRYKRVTWKSPNLAWAIDGTEYGQDKDGNKLMIHPVQDLCARYRFEPLVALESKGDAVALHLQKLFKKYGAPLFLKRDNGSSLNAAVVDAVLAEFGVIPLNSPAYYPRYNGAIERGIREVKEALGESLPTPELWQPEAVTPYINAVHHALNCRKRRSLHGHSAAEAYNHQSHASLKKSERRAVFEWIRIHAIDRMNQLEKVDRRSELASWRLAAETWLRCQGLITVSINQIVLPNLPRKYVCE
jgi:hypothetical protein